MTNAPLPEGFSDPRTLAGLAPDAPLAVALSGGADSVALLAMLAEGGNITALHVHHGIRGEEADRDEAFCRQTAALLGVPFVALHVDAPLLARERRVGLETAARDARYEAMTAYLTAHGIPLLVTAHHADDQLETLLLNLLRGSGRNGLAGIPACRPLADGISVARPLLLVPRHAILSYLQSRRLSFVTDSTNEVACCERNRLRLEVMPLLTAGHPDAAARAARCAATLAEDEAFLCALADDFIKKEGTEPTLAALAALPRPIFVRVMRRLLPIVPMQTHLAALQRLCTSGARHAALSLPSLTVRAVNGRFTVARPKGGATPDYLVPLRHGVTEIPEIGALAILAHDGEQYPLPQKGLYQYEARLALSSAMIRGEAVLRPRRTGDRLLSGGMHKTVRRLSALAHLPPDVRTRMPLVADEAGLLAVPFFRVRDGAERGADLTLTLYFN